jgi:DNA-binding MarR family transcriptional regulator
MKPSELIRFVQPLLSMSSYAFAPASFTARSLVCLAILAEHSEEADMRDVRISLKCSNAALCRVLDMLSINSLVIRRSAEHDRRTRLISITPDGRKLLKSMGVEA